MGLRHAHKSIMEADVSLRLWVDANHPVIHIEGEVV